MHLHNFVCNLSSLAVTVMFSQSLYTVDEDAGSIQIGLVLSNVSSTDVTVEVFSTDRSATGEYWSIFSNSILKL